MKLFLVLTCCVMLSGCHWHKFGEISEVKPCSKTSKAAFADFTVTQEFECRTRTCGECGYTQVIR